MKARLAAIAAGLIFAATAAEAQVLISQGFDNVPTLAATWPQADASTPAPVVGWSQGNAGIFTSQGGAPNSYIAINPVTATDFASSVSHYLMTPVISLATPTTLSFYARSAGIDDAFPDRLQVFLSTAGSSTAIASFSAPALFDSVSIGNTWTLETISITAQGAGATGRLAWRYFIPDTAVAGDYLGIDTVTITAVAEPSVVASMLMGFGALSLAISRRKNRRAKSRR